MGSFNLILSKNQVIDEKYSVQFPIKKGSYAETYRVKDTEGKTKFLKLIDYAKLHRSQFNENGDVLEMEIIKQIHHPNLVNYSDSGHLIIDNKKYAYIILDFISGETLADRMVRENTFNLYETKNIISGVLNGLNFLHKKQIIHNDINNQNIMLDLSRNTPIPKIIDFGYARYFQQTNKDFQKEGLNPFYTANEVFNKIFSFQSDIFSVGALYYHLLEGLPPYFIELSQYKSDTVKLEDTIIAEREKSLDFNNIKEDRIQKIITKSLSSSPENRFHSVKEFTEALSGEKEVQLSVPEPKESLKAKPKKKKGAGFSAIAGMQKLKDTIQLDVIDALNDKEKYAEYGLSIPNGMLLYGPPGCGKTFFAEKMAEEIGFNFYQIKPSDIQSKYVNASQENIKGLFDKARKNAPSIIFIDELDAMVPSRDTSHISQMNASAVNEFLAQMNNCGEEGIFTIGATNRPNAIDSAILRAGRLDKKIYVPTPDFEARLALFEIYLKKRPTEIGIDKEKLTVMTENYASVDIKNICDEASRQTLKENIRISFEILQTTIKNTLPSSTKEELEKYESIKGKMEGGNPISNDRRPIGF